MIETKRLILREYTPDDFDALYEIVSDPETMAHYPAPFDEARTRRWIDWNMENYKTETDLPEEMLEKLPLFIDMVLIENIVDELECCTREGETLDWEDIADAAESLIQGIPYAGIGQQ